MHETTIGCGCGCGANCTCGTIPAEFVRVRYYFGQRLGVMELNDQFVYHAGKMAFHNSRLHGFGILCGLRAERDKPLAPATTSTVLRVTSGAAIDPCGREIVVSVDQCIDVAAWFARNRTRPALAGWTAGTTQTLRVAIRFRECPSDPAPAPRDPCGCDNGGCEFGRVREGFELGLFTDGENICAVDAFPPTADVLAAAAAGPDGAAIKAAFDALVAKGCPSPGEDLWLCLATLQVTLDASPMPVDISAPDNAIPERRTLLATRALQDLVLGMAATGAAAGMGAFAQTPRAGALAFAPSAADPTKAGTVTVPIILAQKGSPLVDVKLDEVTFDAAFVKTSRLDAGGWTDVTPTGPAPAEVKYDAAAKAIQLVFTQDLAAGPLFVLAFEPPAATPTVDEDGTPLRPFTRRFRFTLNAGALALVQVG